MTLLSFPFYTSFPRFQVESPSFPLVFTDLCDVGSYALVGTTSRASFTTTWEADPEGVVREKELLESSRSG